MEESSDLLRTRRRHAVIGAVVAVLIFVGNLVAMVIVAFRCSGFATNDPCVGASAWYLSDHPSTTWQALTRTLLPLGATIAFIGAAWTSTSTRVGLALLIAATAMTAALWAFP